MCRWAAAGGSCHRSPHDGVGKGRSDGSRPRDDRRVVGRPMEDDIAGADLLYQEVGGMPAPGLVEVRGVEIHTEVVPVAQLQPEPLGRVAGPPSCCHRLPPSRRQDRSQLTADAAVRRSGSPGARSPPASMTIITTSTSAIGALRRAPDPLGERWSADASERPPMTRISPRSSYAVASQPSGTRSIDRSRHRAPESRSMARHAPPRAAVGRGCVLPPLSDHQERPGIWRVVDCREDF